MLNDILDGAAILVYIAIVVTIIGIPTHFIVEYAVKNYRKEDN